MGWYEQAAELRKELPALGAAVAEQLGEGWSSEFLYDNGCELTGPDGARLWMIPGHHDASKVQIIGTFPHGVHMRESQPSINVAVSRGAVAITKEITRRLLPEYLPLQATALERQRAEQQREAAQQATIERIVNAWPGSTVHGDTVYARVRGDYLKFRVTYAGRSVEIQGSFDVDLALAMLTLAGQPVTNTPGEQA